MMLQQLAEELEVLPPEQRMEAEVQLMEETIKGVYTVVRVEV
jgi:hypothetical protein